MSATTSRRTRAGSDSASTIAALPPIECPSRSAGPPSPAMAPERSPAIAS